MDLESHCWRPSGSDFCPPSVYPWVEGGSSVSLVLRFFLVSASGEIGDEGSLPLPFFSLTVAGKHWGRS